MNETVAISAAPENSVRLNAPAPIQTERHRYGLAVVLAIFLIGWVCTGAHFMADTSVYVSAILSHQHGLPADDYHRLTANPFWEFGHLLWRPLGWASFVVGEPVTRAFHRSERVEVIWSLMAIDLLASITCVACFFLLARRLIEDEWVALLSTVLLTFSNAFLNYSHTGNAYPVGLACLVGGMYFSVLPSASAISFFRAAISGFLLALAVLFWFPYIFVLPAVFAAPLLLYGSDRQRLRLTGLSIAICGVVGFTAYCLAIAFVGIRSFADLRAWILAAGHGQVQAGGLRAVARLAFSLPRSFINMGNDGIVLKRYLVHDPYASERLSDLLRLSLWKLVLFYASLIAVCFCLLRFQRGRAWLVVFAIAALPIVLFSLFLFEAGSIERYLPLDPFVFLAWGYALASCQVKAFPKALLFALLGATLFVNLNAMRRDTLEKQENEGGERIRDLVPKLTPASLVLAVNEQDSLAEFCHEFPLDRLNSEYQWQYYDVLEINAARLSTWRQDLATRILWSWHHGGAVWMPIRFLHDRPNRNWNWVEGDDPRVRWSDLPAFFSQFNVGSLIGGQDGFVSLPDDPVNEGILINVAKGAPTSR